MATSAPRHLKILRHTFKSKCAKQQRATRPSNKALQHGVAVLPGKDVHHSISVGKSLSSPVQTGTPRHIFAKTCATVCACLAKTSLASFCLAKTSADFRHEVLPGVKKVCCHILLLDTEVS